MEQHHHISPMQRYLLALALLLMLAGIVYVLSPREALEEGGEEEPASLSEMIRSGRADIPTYSSSTAERLAKSSGFQVLISYTDNGFEPPEVTIGAGETIRFTNNSSGQLWVAASGTNAQLYPRTKEVCGSSDLDSCEALAPQDFWEFRFDVAGAWVVMNNLDKAKHAVVRVE